MGGCYPFTTPVAGRRLSKTILGNSFRTRLATQGRLASSGQMMTGTAFALRNPPDPQVCWSFPMNRHTFVFALIVGLIALSAVYGAFGPTPR
jgi:hypothetical protein